MEGAPHFIPKVLHLCDGVGWRGGHWCYRSGDAPTPTTRPANVPFCSKSFEFFGVFFSWIEMHVNFLKVLFTTGRECAPHSSPSLPTAPPRLLGPLSRPLFSETPLLLSSSHPHTSLLVCPSSSLLGFRAQISQSTKQFSPWGGRKQETLYLFCMCIII